MTINRHTHSREPVTSSSTSPSSAGGRVPDDVLLDAARTCVLTHGMQRTTLVGVARAAGVSRMTLYRRFADIDSILTTLLTRECDTLLQQIVHHTTATTTARQQLVDTALAMVHAFADDPLVRAVLDRDSALGLPAVIDHMGRTQRLVEERLQLLIRQGHQDGSVRSTDTAAQVRVILLTVRSFVLSWPPAVTEVSASALLHELRHMLDSALANNE